MKEYIRKSLVLLLVLVVSLFVVVTPVFADDNTKCVSTSILGDGNQVCDDGSGSSVWIVINTVIDIMSVGVGILGVIGIMVVGVQYLTAGGNEERATKAKRRMYEIVIGLVAYAVLFGLLTWLIPNFSTNAPAGNVSSSGSSNNGSSGSQGSQSSSKLVNTFKEIDGKKYYYDANGEKVTGPQEINGAHYYFGKNGAMKTGWVAIKDANGNKKRYYYKSNGKQAFGTIKAKGKYNETNKRDKWDLNDRTGEVEGVELAVPRIAQSGYNCGPTSVLMVRTYFVGKKDFQYNGRSYAWNNEPVWGEMCGAGEIWPECVATFGYKRKIGSYESKKGGNPNPMRQLFSGKPFIFRWAGASAPAHGYASTSSGHFMVVSGYHNGVYTIKDPAGGSTPRKTSIPASYLRDYYPGPITFYYFSKMK